MKVTQDYGWVEAVEASPETWQYMAKQAERTTITEVIYTQVPFGRTYQVVGRKVIRTRRPDEMPKPVIIERVDHEDVASWLDVYLSDGNDLWQALGSTLWVDFWNWCCWEQECITEAQYNFLVSEVLPTLAR